MKRVLSFVLALSLIAGLMTGLTLTASAETIVSEIAITGVTTPMAGAAPTTAGISTSEAYFQDVYWQVWNYTDGYFQMMEDGETFADGNVYKLNIDLWVNDGYRFPWEGLTASVNGTVIPEFDSHEFGAYLEMVYVMSGITMLDQVVIESLPAVAAGTSTDLTTGITLPAGANYTVQGNWYAHVYNEQEGYWSSEWYDGAQLQDGTHYYLHLDIRPNAGYWIHKNTELKINGDVQPYWTYSYNGNTQANVDYDLRPVVSEIALTTAGTAAYGTAVSSVTVTAPEGANYTVRAQWTTWDSNTGGYVAATGNFGYGTYRLAVTVTPNEGYTVRDDVVPTINGTVWDNIEGWEMQDWDGLENGFTLLCYSYIVPENGYAYDAELSGAPESITAGAAITAPTVTVVDGNVTVTGTKWVDEDREPVTGKFEANKSYYLAIDLAPKAGYAFASWIEAYVDDEECFGYDISSDRASATVYVYYTLKPLVESVNIIVTEPVIGAAPGAVTLPSGVKYALETDEDGEWPGYYWYCYSDDEITVFEDGKKYELAVYLIPAEGYEFSKDLVVSINGVALDDDSYWCSGEYLSIWKNWSFQEVIDKVDITVPAYKVGDVFKQEDITLPEGIGCEINHVSIYGRYTDPYEAIGKDRYDIYIELYVKDGYEFSEDCAITINGKATDDVWGGTSWIDCYYEFSLCDQITKVEFPAYPTVNVGDTAENKDLTAPEGANYTLYSMWFVATDDGMEYFFEGTIENNSAYYLQMYAQPNEGYEFSEDCVITVGGTEVSLQLMRVDSEGAYLLKLYNFGVKTIDKVELTITAPAHGQKPSATVTLPDGAHYSVDDIIWLMSESGEYAGLDQMGRKDTFAYGNYYYVYGAIEAAEGYIFAEDVKLIINGKEVEMKVDETSSYLAGNEGQLFHNFGKLEETSYDDNPKTGDTGIAVLTALMVLSATAAGVVISKKKEF